MNDNCDDCKKNMKSKFELLAGFSLLQVHRTNKGLISAEDGMKAIEGLFGKLFGLNEEEKKDLLDSIEKAFPWHMNN